MKATELVKGRTYWCGWACRYARFEKIETRVWAGEKITKVVFRDECNMRIDCGVESVEKWVKERN